MSINQVSNMITLNTTTYFIRYYRIVSKNHFSKNTFSKAATSKSPSGN